MLTVVFKLLDETSPEKTNDINLIDLNIQEIDFRIENSHNICIYFQIKPKYTHDKIETTKKELQFLNPNGAGLLDVA